MQPSLDSSSMVTLRDVRHLHMGDVVGMQNNFANETDCATTCRPGK